MARPQKATVDYFPHDTQHGSTLFILESRWGNDGYAFWFKLLEALGNHEGHFIDCQKPAEWELLLAKTKVDAESATEILGMLARMDAIDSRLWLECSVIASANFLARIADAYRKRKDSFPTIETIYSVFNVCTDEFPAPETPQQRVSGAGSTERERERERESKGKWKGKKDGGSDLPPAGDSSPSPQALADLWNQVVVNPSVKELGKARVAKIRLRLKERSLDAWRGVFERIKASRFCMGENERGWAASFDWIIRSEETAARVLEGKYDNRDNGGHSAGAAASRGKAEDARARVGLAPTIGNKRGDFAGDFPDRSSEW